MSNEENQYNDELDASKLTGEALIFYNHYIVYIKSAVSWQNRIPELKPLVKEVQKQLMIMQKTGVKDTNAINAIDDLKYKLNSKIV